MWPGIRRHSADAGLAVLTGELTGLVVELAGVGSAVGRLMRSSSW